MKNLLAEIELADAVGLDVFAIGEHHRPDYAVSSPTTVLAAGAAVTKNIKLSSAVTVLSSEDPVRVFQQFATVDLLSGGRAEIMAGRGAFIESFPLFGYALSDYEELFTEKLDLLLKINAAEKVSWKGEHRAPIQQLGIYPRPLQKHLPVWLAIGGTPASVIRAADLGLPIALAMLGGQPAHFLPIVDVYREAAKQKETSGEHRLRVSLNMQGYVAETTQQAMDEFYPFYEHAMNRIGRERGWVPVSRQQFEAGCSPQGALLVGSAQQVIDKILSVGEMFNNDRLVIRMDVGGIDHDKLMHSIELFGNKVAPVIRKSASVASDRETPVIV